VPTGSCGAEGVSSETAWLRRTSEFSRVVGTVDPAASPYDRKQFARGTRSNVCDSGDEF
jgi:hypothetical protein